jgi:hypothetical protein
MYAFALLISLLTFVSILTKAWPYHSYITQPNFTIPAFNTSKSGEALAPGYIFITPSSPTVDASLIMTDNGTLIWSSNRGYFTNLFVQSLDKRPILTYWEGTGSANVAEQGHGHGLVHILDTSYTEIYTICPDFGLYTVNNTALGSCQADLHESYVTDYGSILVTAYNATKADLTAVGGAADGWVWDCLFYEIDIKTRKQLFSWSALAASIPITDSKQTLDGAGSDANPYDWFHINSVQKVGDGYLVNSRNLWTTYMLNSSGKIEWRLEVRLFFFLVSFIELLTAHSGF